MTTRDSANQRARDERGVVLVIVALFMVALLAIAAIVIDMSVVRDTRQENKSAADLAVAAGMRGLDNPTGIPRPWAGVCRAIEYLRTNKPELADLSGTYSTVSTPEHPGVTAWPASPCSNQSVVPYVNLCDKDNSESWARFEGTGDGGAVTVEIQTGYTLPDPDFPEDATEYSGDDGTDRLGACGHLAVILRERDAEQFGSVVGASGYETVIRSVGRTTTAEDPTTTIAVLLLEQRACRALYTSGNNTYVRVRATPVDSPEKPGIIQANSDGRDCTGGQRVIEGSSVCPALSNCVGSGPSIVAESIPDVASGILGTPAASRNPSSATSASCPNPSQPTSGCTVAPIASDRGLVTRAQVDARYLSRVRSLEETAAAEYGRTASDAAAAGYYVISNCSSLDGKTVSTGGSGPNVISTDRRANVFLDCSLSINSNRTVTFDSTIDSLVVAGTVSVGSGALLDAQDVRNFYVRGTSGTATAVNVNGGTLAVNRGSSATCTARQAAEPRHVTQFVVGTGALNAGSNAALHLCGTFLYLADGTLPGTFGVAPYDNAFNGNVTIGSQSAVDWKAPNQTNDKLENDSSFYDTFEDLALWTEYSGNCAAGNAPVIGGQGSLVATGIFFLPNACPFKLAGGGDGAVIQADAQFVVRRLELTGTVALTVAPNPTNTVAVPYFDSFSLVR